MPFNKGASGNSQGRPKGSRNKNTTERAKIIQSIIESELDKIEEHFSEMNSREILDFVSRLLPYYLPKIKPNEVQNIEDSRPINPLIIVTNETRN